MLCMRVKKEIIKIIFIQSVIKPVFRVFQVIAVYNIEGRSEEVKSSSYLIEYESYTVYDIPV